MLFIEILGKWLVLDLLVVNLVQWVDVFVLLRGYRVTVSVVVDVVQIVIFLDLLACVRIFLQPPAMIIIVDMVLQKGLLSPEVLYDSIFFNFSLPVIRFLFILLFDIVPHPPDLLVLLLVTDHPCLEHPAQSRLAGPGLAGPVCCLVNWFGFYVLRSDSRRSVGHTLG